MTILRSDDSRTWKEHPIATTEEAVQKCLSGNFEGEGDYVCLVHGCTAFPLYISLVIITDCVCVCVCGDHVLT